MSVAAIFWGVMHNINGAMSRFYKFVVCNVTITWLWRAYCLFAARVASFAIYYVKFQKTSRMSILKFDFLATKRCFKNSKTWKLSRREKLARFRMVFSVTSDWSRTIVCTSPCWPISNRADATWFAARQNSFSPARRAFFMGAVCNLA